MNPKCLTLGQRYHVPINPHNKEETRGIIHVAFIVCKEKLRVKNVPVEMSAAGIHDQNRHRPINVMPVSIVCFFSGFLVCTILLSYTHFIKHNYTLDIEFGFFL